MRLPNAEYAFIAESKLRDYLLNPAGKDPSKARLFAALGYTRESWHALEQDIRDQRLDRDAQEIAPNAFGRKWQIVGLLRGPTGSANIVTIWTVEYGTDRPRLVTAYRV